MWDSVSPHEGIAEYWVDVNTLEIFRVDDDTANLTEQQILSQGLVLSLGMVEGLIWGNDIDTESLDISRALLQALRYEDLERLSRQLGFAQKALRSVCVVPPENAWSHFRRMSDAPDSLKIPGASRAHWCLKALKATYGFSDAPLMFQLALLQYLEEECGAYKSLFDSNFLYWVEYVDDKWQLTLLLTAHIDDLQVTGCLGKAYLVAWHVRETFWTSEATAHAVYPHGYRT